MFAPAEIPIVKNRHLATCPGQVEMSILSHTPYQTLGMQLPLFSQFMHSPSEDHWETIMWIMRYDGRKIGKLNVGDHTHEDCADTITDIQKIGKC